MLHCQVCLYNNIPITAHNPPVNSSLLDKPFMIYTHTRMHLTARIWGVYTTVNTIEASAQIEPLTLITIKKQSISAPPDFLSYCERYF